MSSFEASTNIPPSNTGGGHGRRDRNLEMSFPGNRDRGWEKESLIFFSLHLSLNLQLLKLGVEASPARGS
jgi:hypothetical protein